MTEWVTLKYTIFTCFCKVWLWNKLWRVLIWHINRNLGLYYQLSSLGKRTGLHYRSIIYNMTHHCTTREHNITIQFSKSSITHCMWTKCLTKRLFLCFWKQMIYSQRYMYPTDKFYNISTKNMTHWTKCEMVNHSGMKMVWLKCPLSSFWTKLEAMRLHKSVNTINPMKNSYSFVSIKRLCW